MINLKITELLQTKLGVNFLQVIDESHLHAGHAEAGRATNSHFRIQIGGGALIGKGRIEQHKMIYSALAELMNNPIHALAIEVV